MIFGTAGHIDHGKTAVVRALTGVDTDRLPEERRRGISIELGFAPLVLGDGSVVSIIDVPGHERLVDTMIAGASGIDAALLVIAASEGVMPQTREHCAVLRALRVPVAAVAVTKIDRLDDASRSAAIARIRESVTECGVPAVTPVCPVNAPAAEGMDALHAALTDAAAGVRRRDPDDLFRFVVDRAFSVRGTGTVVTGTVWSGSVGVGERVRVLPDGRTWRVRAVQAHGAAATHAVAGARFALALADAAPTDVARGATLVTDDAWTATSRIVVRLDSVSGSLPRRFALQLGGVRADARWNAAHPGSHVVRLALDRPLVARRGDRLVLRVGDGAAGITGAVVLDPFPERGPTIVGDDPVEHLVVVTRAAGLRGIARAALPVRLGTAPRATEHVISTAGVAEVGERVIDRAALSRLAARVAECLEQEMDVHPFAGGLGADELGALLHVPAPVLEAALDEAGREGRVRRAGGRAIAAHALPAAAEALLGELLGWIAAAGIEGVTAEEAARTFGSAAEAALHHAERAGNLIRLGGVRYCEASVVGWAVARLRAAMRSGREFTPGELRGVFGVSRKYLIPLLEYCDAARVTVRRSGGRVLSDVSSP